MLQSYGVGSCVLRQGRRRAVGNATAGWLVSVSDILMLIFLNAHEAMPLTVDATAG